jgi:methionyl-tRNA formyltransferase
MRVVLMGRQDFGKATLDALLARGDTVAAVFCAPDAPNAAAGAKPDALKEAALAHGLPVHQFASLKSDEALAALRACEADIGLMAYVLQFVPQAFALLPKHGMVQYHPSLLPRYRGPSAISWAIARGERQTGLSIFRPTDGLDEGAVILQKTVPIAPDATLGTVYFEHLFPLGVQALLEAADLVIAGQHSETVQDETQANYEGWLNAAAAQIHPTQHVDEVYNLIRACNPAPGAWLSIAGQSVQCFDAQKHPHRTHAQVLARKAKVGQVSEISAHSFFFVCNGGEIEVLRAKTAQSKKMNGAEMASLLGLTVGQLLA